MAYLIQAIQTYGPKVELNQTAQVKELAEWLSMRTGANQNETTMLLHELKEAILYFNRQGTPIKLPGLGIFSPSIDRAGAFKVNLRADAALTKGINSPNAYVGRIANRQNIGLDNQALKALWDAEHPGDPLELNGNGG